MASSTRYATLEELGIVPMAKALEDGATQAAEKASQMRLSLDDHSGVKDYRWCTLCQTCIKKRQGRNHRATHGREYDELRASEDRDRICETLDEKYGKPLAIDLHTSRAPCMPPSSVEYLRRCCMLFSCALVPSASHLGAVLHLRLSRLQHKPTHTAQNLSQAQHPA
jgi:hypothetical protein